MMEWVMNTPETAPAFVLARNGYDVWLGNNRGNRFSNSHVSMTVEDKEFWDFYQEDMGLYDLPALILFIKEKTGQESISYVGHSEGTTQLFMGGSLLPDFFRIHINLAIMTGPVACTANIPSPMIRFAASKIKEI
jgi:lysosomal acid lipase/cholesteryl ester hydrolase